MANFLEGEAISHNVFSEAMFHNNVIDCLTKHPSNWTANKHFGGKCKAFPCSCCRAHPKPGSIGYAPQQHQPADEWACELCLGAWTLSTVSSDARNKVLANAGQQPRRCEEERCEQRERRQQPFAAKREAESKGIGKGYEPQHQRGRGPDEHTSDPRRSKHPRQTAAVLAGRITGDSMWTDLDFVPHDDEFGETFYYYEDSDLKYNESGDVVPEYPMPSLVPPTPPDQPSTSAGSVHPSIGSRGHLRLLHGGGTTDVVQANDLNLDGRLRAAMKDLEAMSHKEGDIAYRPY